MTMREAVKQLKETCEREGCHFCPYQYFDDYSGGWCCSLSLPHVGVPSEWDEKDSYLGGVR